MSNATTGPYGVNFLMPFLDPAAVAAAAERCPIVEFFFGPPDRSLVDVVHEGKALAGWQVGSADEAEGAASAGCDFVIAQGIEAGGHVRGTEPVAEVLAEVVAAVRIPVVAAGGIGTPRDVREVLEMGASGVRVGTRFLAATESMAHPEYVDALIGAAAADTALTDTFSHDFPNARHRVLRSAIDAAEADDREFVATAVTDGGEWPVARFSSLPPTKNVRGTVGAMAMYAGTSVDAVHERLPASQIVEELCAEL